MSSKIQPIHDTPPVGGDLKLMLACPECLAEGWVELRGLSHGLRCRRCNCKFLVGRGGRLASEESLPHVRFDCPRCGQNGRILAMYALRKVECGACKLPLEFGPDRQLHGAREAQAMRRAATAAKRHAKEGGQRSWATDPRWRRAVFIALGAVLVVGVGFAMWASGAGEILAPTAADQAARFTQFCLAGETEQAAALVVESQSDAPQFNYWRSSTFRTLQDSARPADDVAEVSVEQIEAAGDHCVLDVTIESPSLGTRIHRQHWQKTAAGWRFDAAATQRARE